MKELVGHHCRHHSQSHDVKKTHENVQPEFPVIQWRQAQPLKFHRSKISRKQEAGRREEQGAGSSEEKEAESREEKEEEAGGREKNKMMIINEQGTEIIS